MAACISYFKTNVQTVIQLFGFAIAVTALSLTTSQANAQLVFGAAARAEFEIVRPGDNFQDFSSAPFALTDQIVGLVFNTIKDQNFGIVTPPRHVVVSNRTGRVGQIVGSSAGGADDGQFTYQIVFDDVQRRAGLMRNWNTFAQTKFFNLADGQLGEHQNTIVGPEFVGYEATSDDPNGWIKRIEMTGLVAPDGFVKSVIQTTCFMGPRRFLSRHPLRFSGCVPSRLRSAVHAAEAKDQSI